MRDERQSEWLLSPRGLARRFAAQLPRGWKLSDDTWRIRHRGILVVLWLHVPSVFVFAWRVASA